MCKRLPASNDGKKIQYLFESIFLAGFLSISMFHQKFGQKNSRFQSDFYLNVSGTRTLETWVISSPFIAQILLVLLYSIAVSEKMD